MTALQPPTTTTTPGPRDLEQKRWPPTASASTAAGELLDPAPSYHTVYPAHLAAQPAAAPRGTKQPLFPPEPAAAAAASPRDTRQPLFPPKLTADPSSSSSSSRAPPVQPSASSSASSSNAAAAAPPTPYPAVPVNPVVDSALFFKGATAADAGPYGGGNARLGGFASQPPPPEKKKKNTILLAALVLLAAAIVAAAAIAAAVIVTNKNKNSSSSQPTVTESDPPLSSSSSSSSSPSSPTATASPGQSAIPTTFQIRLRGTASCVAGAVLEQCEAAPAAASRQVFTRDGPVWRQVASGGCISTFGIVSISIETCNSRETFQQLTYLSDGTIHDHLGSCVSSSLAVSLQGPAISIVPCDSESVWQQITYLAGGTIHSA
ncbi:hypothetical protein DFJ73DRAFT_803978 [Zopfochytrium polystomum]|nr:hypothetical protein DFJ73DRAFT_803978 [Zopfochytrium polystomum]